MRHFLTGLALGIAVSFLASQLTAATPASAASGSATEIISDVETGAIKFIVNGKEAGRFDTNGFHVRDDLTYGGAITDIGANNYLGGANAD